jgi:hypothetical protein
MAMEMLGDKYKIIDGEICVCTEELCAKMGISRKTLSDWEQKGCPKSARGWWPIWNILKWRGLTSGGIKTEEDLENITLSQQKIMYEAELKKQH